MNIREAIVHRVDKERQQNCTVVYRNDCLPIDELLIGAVEKTRKTYGTASNRAFGTFEPDTLLFPFSRILSDYLDGKASMLDFSKQAMKLFEKEIKKAPLATGGYAFFVNYEEGGKDYFMVALLKLRGGVGIDENKLSLNRSFNLDVDNLHEAARINVSNWKAVEGKYISFVKKGNSDQDFTDYFRDFLGCAEFVESKDQTGALIKAIREYCVASGLDADQSKKLKAKAYDYFEEQARDKKSISLASMSMRFDDKNPKQFLEYIEKNAAEVSDGFEPHRSTFRQLKRIGGKDADLTINFDRSLIGKRVLYDKIKKELRIIDLPASLIADLDTEI